jgi:hypothetical protein
VHAGALQASAQTWLPSNPILGWSDSSRSWFDQRFALLAKFCHCRSCKCIVRSSAYCLLQLAYWSDSIGGGSEYDGIEFGVGLAFTDVAVLHYKGDEETCRHDVIRCVWQYGIFWLAQGFGVLRMFARLLVDMAPDPVS